MRSGIGNRRGLPLHAEILDGHNHRGDKGIEEKQKYTVSWWIRILNCIEEVPQVHFSIQFKFTLDFQLVSIGIQIEN
jgi:hypothetical protein